MWDGKVAFVLVFAVIASAVVGRIVAAYYRKRVLALMSQGTPPTDDDGAPAMLLRPAHAARASSTAQNRSARRKLALTIIAISLAVGLTQSWWSLQFVYNETGYGPIKLALFGLGLCLGDGAGPRPAVALELAAHCAEQRGLRGAGGDADLPALDRGAVAIRRWCCG